MQINKIALSNTPTRIDKLVNTSSQYNKNIYIKRDDQTGTELSGNKIRKLEFSIAEAIQQGCDTLITCGGLQSNHCRATVTAAIMLNLDCIIVLRSDENPPCDGNYFLDKLLGAKIIFISGEQYSNSRQQIMQEIADSLVTKGRKGYIIPEGASNGIGTLGYMHAMQEIINQEKELDICFDTIVCTIGSGGTYAGLCLGNKLYQVNKNIIGINICNTAEHFRTAIKGILTESYQYIEQQDLVEDADIHIIDGYGGLGYGLNKTEELDFIKQFAQTEAIILDPVYTGKAMYGLISELNKNQCPLLAQAKNILFIHTGGLFGIFPKKNEFPFAENK